MKGLHGWLKLLAHNDSAIFSTLLLELDKVLNSENSSGEQLAKVILKDAFLTTKIIRVANSVNFNLSEVPVTTVSRAVINIGFENIKSICVSIKVLETLGEEGCSDTLLSSLANSLHAANQAKVVCPKLNDTKREEIFVASILCRLTEQLVLGFKDQEVKDFSNELTAHSTEQEKDRAAEKYLGVSLTRLTKSLIKQWRIEGLALDFVNAIGLQTDSKFIESIRLGHEISRAALLGWDSNEFKDVVKKVSEFQGTNPADVIKNLKKTADDTSEIIKSFGKQGLVDFIPTSKRAAKEVSINKNGSTSGPKSNSALQDACLNKLSENIETNFNINKVINLVLQGLNQGVGLERVSLAIFDIKLSRFMTKYALGNKTDTWKQQFSVCFEPNPSSFLYQLFEHEHCVWAGGEQFTAITKNMGNEFSEVTGQNHFFIAPLKTNGKKIGFIYADMGETGVNLSLDAFEQFNIFVQQTNLALRRLATSK